MPKAGKTKAGGKSKPLPTTSKRKELGVPKFSHKTAAKQAMPYGKAKILPPTSVQHVRTMASLAVDTPDNSFASTSQLSSIHSPVDASLTVRDSSAKAFMRELRKVIERSDVIIQVLDARDPEGTRSRWVEEEVRKRDGQGKKLLAVVNKIDLVPRSNLEAWLKYLRHDFACMPFKSSTQNQRQHLSQNAVPLVSATSVPGQSATPSLPSLPTTSSSLGAPALLHLLKQYALSTPHSSLTVGVIGYPNVGKSSLINSLKRSRACGVAAMPGKTRVVQEVVLDKGVKILDCPGVVLEDFGREMEGEAARKRQAEIMLRNCVKAELVEDPTAPVEVILSRVESSVLEKLYNIPPFDDLRDFLIKLALTRGRLGKGGIPDLHGSALSVLRDWNSGKIPFHSTPPSVHPSSAPVMSHPGSTGEAVGDAKILNTLSEAFTLDGLFDHFGDEAGWEGEDWAAEEAMIEDPEVIPEPIPALPSSPGSDSDLSEIWTRPVLKQQQPPPEIRFNPYNPTSKTPAAHPSKLFTPEELSVLPAESIFDRQKLKQQAKKAKKRRDATEKTEGELMFGLMGMGMDEDVQDEMDVGITHELLTKKSKKEKKKAAARAKKPVGGASGHSMRMELDEDLRKEQDFARFLAGVGADSDEEL